MQLTESNVAAPEVPLIVVSEGADDFGKGYGTFEIKDVDHILTDELVFNEIETMEKGRVLVKGHLRHSLDYDCLINFTLEFRCINEHQLGFTCHLQDVDDSSMDAYKIFLNLKTCSEESFLGLGEQFSHFNLKGHAFPVMVREDGVGRGLQPVIHAFSFLKLI